MQLCNHPILQLEEALGQCNPPLLLQKLLSWHTLQKSYAVGCHPSLNMPDNDQPSGQYEYARGK